MTYYQPPPSLQQKIRRKKKRTGYGAVQPPTHETPIAYGKAAGPLIPSVRELPRVGEARAKDLPKPIAAPIPIPQAKLAVPSRFLIEGKNASDLEWRVWRMLLKLGWPQSEIDFQTAVVGGHMPGGMILDFVIWTPGQPTILEPSADYWHIHTPQQVEHDRVRIAALQKAWGRPFTYQSLGSGDLLTDEMAYNRLWLLVGRYA